MRKIARLVLLLHRDRVLREQLSALARLEGWELRSLRDWDQLLEAVRHSPASVLVIVDPYEGGQPGSRALAVELAALLNRFPSLTVTAALSVGPGCLEDVRKLGEWGVVQIIDIEEERTSFAIGDRLQMARGRPLRILVERAIPPSVSGTARTILTAAAGVASAGGDGKDLARSLYVTTRTLLRWSRKAALPAPRPLLAWMRILLAAELLDDPGRTITDVAYACGYSSDSSLRHALRIFVKLTPTKLRDEGAFDSVSRAFLQALAEARSTRKRYRASPSSTTPARA